MFRYFFYYFSKIFTPLNFMNKIKQNLPALLNINIFFLFVTK